MKTLKALGWLALGLGLGSGGTLLLQQWTAASATAPKPPVEKQRPPAALTTELLLVGEPAMGSSDAPLTIVEFSDFECSYCRRFHEQVLPSLKRDYIDTGLVRFIHKDLPLPFHRQAKPAAAAARCAAEQNRYWDLYSALFDQQTCLACRGVVGIAEDINLDASGLQACMQQDTTQALINANLSEAELHNIRATPTFIIGPSRSDGKHHGNIVEGALPWPQFKALIDQQLSEERGS
jgi:protein-disulfide isomerase